ncbi:CrcB family protein [Microbacterium sp. SORGH_AS_0888]|uniref:fluoride efflux transporter FluC n=1 Tax=Microbacterium sp. SORGH_AS_0888 TaxID=3041791 RepID=UPI0027853B74|nr:CrcB family protein [Microbacterium sp. SORGH_AS_0888]MDQ1130143.1 CrcB protein [Microbacterium sp. SORGH_AS_0888]
MSLGLFLLVTVCGGGGAALRYLVDLGVTRVVGARFLWGTLVINVSGSFALGLLVGATTDATVLGAVGTGLLGGYTTFSSVASGTVLLAMERRTAAALANTVGTLVLTVAAAAGGLALGAMRY